MNVATLTLPLPHDWFAAQTALPKNRFRMSRLRVRQCGQPCACLGRASKSGDRTA
jgi:hypothetical protein